MNVRLGIVFVAFLALFVVNGCAPAHVGFIVIDATGEPLPNVHVESEKITSRYPLLGWIRETVSHDVGVTAADGSLPTTSIAHNETLKFRSQVYPMVKVRAHGTRVFLFRPPPPPVQQGWLEFMFEEDDFDYSKSEVQSVRAGQPAVIEMKRYPRRK